MHRVSCYALAALCLATATAQDLSIAYRPQLLYSNVSPKLRIQGTGFTGVASDYSFTFMPPMPAGKFNVSISSDTVISLGLTRGEQWADVVDPEVGTTIFLTSLKVRGAEKLTAPAQVATILSTPTVKRGDDRIIYMGATPRFLINGTGFRSKVTTLTFDPPLERDVDYIMQVRSSECLQLTLKSGKNWRTDKEPGPLKLKRLNTGGGDLRIDAKYGGVTVAEVQANLGAHGVTVETTAEEKLYQSQGELTVLGTGFNTSRLAGAPGLPNPNTLRWSNGIRGKGTNYTVVSASADGTQLQLKLAAGSKWRINPTNLPGPLVLLAVDAGAGFVPVGPTEAKKGRVVATVFEDPVIQAAPSTILFTTHSHELWLVGSGFTRNSYTMSISFERKFKLGEDFTLSVINRTHAVVSLIDGKTWGVAGPLKVTSINTGAGPFQMSPITVATVTDDAEDHESGLTVTKTAGQSLYQSANIHKLVIEGKGFNNDPAIVFSPPLTKGVDYTIMSSTDTKITLKRLKNKKWRESPGALLVISLDTGDEHGAVSFAFGNGIPVATILPDPTVLESERIIYASHTPRLIVQGTGFALDGTELTLSPTPRSAYEVESIESTEMVLSLNTGKKWANPKGEESVTVTVSKVDTGAGEVVLPDVVIAKVLVDSDGANCDDSCEWALDGVCDDGTNSGRYWWDDDYGGFYGADDDYYSEGYYYDDDDDFLAPVCDQGTDCTDCGGPKVMTEEDLSRCDNSCQWSNDGYCDDTRTSGLCELGTDCHDCGPIDKGNYSTWDDDGWWDDDDNYWDDDYDMEGFELTDDAPVISNIVSLPSGRESATRQVDLDGDQGAGGIFMLLLEGIVYLIGALICGVGSWLGVHYYKGQSLPISLPTARQDGDYEMGGRGARGPANVPITPDVVRS